MTWALRSSQNSSNPLLWHSSRRKPSAMERRPCPSVGMVAGLAGTLDTVTRHLVRAAW